MRGNMITKEQFEFEKKLIKLKEELENA